MIYAEDGFKDDELYLKNVASLIREYCDQYKKEHNEPMPKYEMAHPYVKSKYPNCTSSDFRRAMHVYCTDLLLYTELTKTSVYKDLQRAYLMFPKHMKRLAECANVTEEMASFYTRFWAANGNKLSDECLYKFNTHYQSYLDGDILISEFSKKIFNSTNAVQILLLHMQQNFLISKSHYQRAKSKIKKRGLEFTITGDYINKIFVEQNGRCAVTNTPICSFYTDRNAVSPLVYSIDRIDNALGYLPGNIRLTTKNANICRGSLTVNEFKEFIVVSFMNIAREDKNLNHLYDEKVLEKISFDKEPRALLSNVNDCDDLLIFTEKSNVEPKKVEYDYCCE